MKDKQGRLYATVAGTKEGDVIVPDADFICMRSWVAKTVEKDEKSDRLFVPCTAGKHFLDGRVEADGKRYYIGFYPAETFKEMP